MKKYTSFSIPLVLSAALILSSCYSFVTMSIPMMEPSGTFISPDIKTVAIINRAIPSAYNKRANQIESVISMEGHNEDKQGRQQILEGLNSALLQSPRLKGKLTGIEMYGDGTGTTFPEPLSWDTIAKICADQHVDAVVALETYDSDCIITNATGSVTMTNAFGISIPTPQFYATQKITIKAGFRLYDNNTKTIVDQYNFSYWRSWNSQAINLAQALSSLYNRQMAVNQTSNESGAYYEKRISPAWMNERRSFWKKGGRSPMAVGGRLAVVSNWADAAEQWKRVLATSSGRKKCGRATYNLALAAEIKGDLFEAKDWISKSYGIYNNKQAPYYQTILNRRYADYMKINQQMQAPDSTGNK